jgi:hypothetical protein
MFFLRDRIHLVLNFTSNLPAERVHEIQLRKKLIDFLLLSRCIISMIDQWISTQAFHPLPLIFLAERETHTRRTELCGVIIIAAWEPDAHALQCRNRTWLVAL